MHLFPPTSFSPAHPHFHPYFAVTDGRVLRLLELSRFGAVQATVADILNWIAVFLTVACCIDSPFCLTIHRCLELCCQLAVQHPNLLLLCLALYSVIHLHAPRWLIGAMGGDEDVVTALAAAVQAVEEATVEVVVATAAVVTVAEEIVAVVVATAGEEIAVVQAEEARSHLDVLEIAVAITAEGIAAGSIEVAIEAVVAVAVVAAADGLLQRSSHLPPEGFLSPMPRSRTSRPLARRHDNLPSLR